MLNANSIRELLLSDITFGMLSVGADMGECFEHVFCCCDYEIIGNEIHSFSNFTEYALVVKEEDKNETFRVIAHKDGEQFDRLTIDDGKIRAGFDGYFHLTEVGCKWVRDYCMRNL